MEPLTHCSALDRRGFLRIAGLAGAAWLTPLGHLLAPRGRTETHGPASRSSCSGCRAGRAELETFDPHPGKNIAGGTGAIKTAVKGVQLAEGLEQHRGGDGVDRR